MAKEKTPRHEKSQLKSALSKYLEEFLDYLLSLLEKNTGSLIDKVTGMLTLKDIIRKQVISVAPIFAAVILILIGISMYVDSLFPAWPAGVSQVVMGVIILLIASLYKKS
jgi:hypothetical protein